MDQISFKANIKGINSEALRMIFEKETIKDTSHTLKLFKRKNPNEIDKFVLSKNGKQTVEYFDNFTEEENMHSLNRLVSIFKILKVKEAQACLKTHKK